VRQLPEDKPAGYDALSQKFGSNANTANSHRVTDGLPAALRRPDPGPQFAGPSCSVPGCL
jgi:hypothetical protein